MHISILLSSALDADKNFKKNFIQDIENFVHVRPPPVSVDDYTHYFGFSGLQPCSELKDFIFRFAEFTESEDARIRFKSPAAKVAPQSKSAEKPSCLWESKFHHELLSWPANIAAT